MKILHGNTKDIYKSPVILILAVIVIVFFVEMVIMMMLANSKPEPLLFNGFLDSLLLVIVLIPVLYFLIYIPMAKYARERKLAEEILIEKEARLRELNATKDKFFSIIAHDLKSPFNAIIGFSKILTEQIKDKNYKGFEEYTGIIHDSSLRAMDLLKNLMAWAGSQTGSIEFNPVEIEIAGLINEVVELSNDAARQKTITISIESPEKATVFADKSMISTILRNLISNAVKFTNPGGQIIITAKEKTDGLIISVCDDGIGMNQDGIYKLFRIEESYSTVGTQNETGTGLGLLLCKEFVIKHGGKIWVESEPGNGTTFYFTTGKIDNIKINSN